MRNTNHSCQFPPPCGLKVCDNYVAKEPADQAPNIVWLKRKADSASADGATYWWLRWLQEARSTIRDVGKGGEGAL